MTSKLTCLIVEDEPIAADVLKDYISQVSFLELKGVCKDAIFALERLKEEPIDVLFLDIHLPKLKGLEFLKILKDKPQTILTTAYHQYALDAFEEDVVDYLMKPIEFSRFLKAVNKLKKKESQPVVNQSIKNNSSKPFRFFNVNKKMVKVFYDDILYIESLREYIRIHTKEKRLVFRQSLSELLLKLPENQFFRIHRSYIINPLQIESIEGNMVHLAGQKLPISKRRKEAFLEYINRQGLIG